eukprot:gene20708-22740_t
MSKTINKVQQLKAPPQISEAFNKHFTSVGPKLAEKITSQPIDDPLKYLGSKATGTKFTLQPYELKAAFVEGDIYIVILILGYVDLSVSLDRLANADLKEFSNFDIESKVCGTRVYCSDCGEDAATWLSTVLGKSCRLLRQNLCQPRFLKRHTVESSTITGVRSRLALANESQYLLISESSLSELTLGLDDSIDKNSVAPSFRANFLIQGFSPFKEESWKEVVIGKCNFKVVGNCKRCNVITINQSTAEKNKKPLEALMKVKGRKMEFGIYLVLSLMSTHEMSISVGQLVVPK